MSLESTLADTTHGCGQWWPDVTLFHLRGKYRVTQVGPSMFRVDGYDVPEVRFFETLAEAATHLALLGVFIRVPPVTDPGPSRAA